MKKTIFLLSALMFAGVAFSQEKTEADYVEYGVDESNPNTYRALDVQMPDGSKKTVFFKKKHFKQENMQGYSSTETIYPLPEKNSRRRLAYSRYGQAGERNRQEEGKQRVCEGNVRRKRSLLPALPPMFRSKETITLRKEDTQRRNFG